MATEVETKEVELGTVADMATYNKMRDEGKTGVIELPAEKPEETDKTEPEEQKPEEKPKPKGGFQKKIDRLFKEKESQRERAERAERRLQELEAKSDKIEEKVSAKALDSDPRPKEDDFHNIADYAEAMGRWGARQENKAQREREEAEAENELVEEVDKTYKARLAEKIGTHEDFDEAISKATIAWTDNFPMKLALKCEGAFLEAIGLTENPYEVWYHYAKHPEERTKLASLLPAQIAREILDVDKTLTPVANSEDEDETEEEIEVEEKPAKIVSKSAPPIKPVNSGATKSTVSLDKTTSMAEYNRLRDAGRVR